MSLTDRDIRISALEKILGAHSSNFISIKDDTDFNLKSDEIFLEHILNKSGVVLSDHTDRTVLQELVYWDRNNLVNLASNIGHYTSNSEDREKIAYLISHSIREDLVQSLSSGNPQDKFAVYNSHVIKRLSEEGVNLGVWLNHGGNLKHTPSLNPQNPFYLETVQWKRDFRSEFAIGDVSECCIAVGENKRGDMYRQILLDYFLDLGIQVLHVRKVAQEKEQKIGQIYFVGLKAQNADGACLGVTSVELSPEYREDIDVVPPMSKTILSQDGYQEMYGFKSAIIGNRFSSFRGYLNKRRAEISNIVSSILKQKKQNLNHDRRKAEREGVPSVPYQEKIGIINNEIADLEEIGSTMYAPSKVYVKKLGLSDSISAGLYNGTNYLDLFDKKNPQRVGGQYISDGFFNTSNPPLMVTGYHLNSEGLFDRLESIMNAIRIKYSTRKQKNLAVAM